MTTHYDIQWLKDRFENGDSLKFKYFWGHTNTYNEAVGKFCFSQWFDSPFTVEGREYKTSEQWMMAQKALLFNDKASYDKIMASATPAKAKELGRYVIGFDEKSWNDKRFDIVKTGNIHKFNQNPALGDYLLNTGNSILVEASPVDAIWGIGLSHDSKHIDNIYAWRGLNLLGFVLMEVRDFLKEFGYFSPLENTLSPLWAKYPGIDKHDMFWRMGKGEDYVVQFSQYYHSLTDREKIIYALTNPAPYDWADYYK